MKKTLLLSIGILAILSVILWPRSDDRTDVDIFSKAHAIRQENIEAPFDVFYDYLNWPNSTVINPDDETLAALFLLQQSSAGTDGSGTSYSYYSQMDINGDGLVDIIYHRTPVYWISDDYLSKFAVLLNKGNSKFETVYKCAYDKASLGLGPWTYYGDCAG